MNGESVTLTTARLANKHVVPSMIVTFVWLCNSGGGLETVSTAARSHRVSGQKQKTRCHCSKKDPQLPLLIEGQQVRRCRDAGWPKLHICGSELAVDNLM